MTQPPQPPEGYYPPQQPQGGYPPPQQPAPGAYLPPQQPPQGGYPPPQQPAPGGYPPPQQFQQGGYPPQYGAPGGADPDIQQNKAMAILSYIGIFVLVPIFAAKQSRFARYHANQGLVLFIAEVGWAIVAQVTLSFVRGLSFYFALNAIFGLVSLAFFILAIIGIVNAAKGEFKPLPLIGSIEILK
ncbi:MAG: hypothetical protein LBS27_02600 [Bifidobacteriaceae bacterium]|jgi:uncharacterized membrane protein|nr:hypothetical protein [Bifidobacteriaceae bacterium]